MPLGDDTYFFSIENRVALQEELLLMLRHIIRLLECHARWQKAGSAPADDDNGDDEDDKYAAYLPHCESLYSLQRLRRKIANDLGSSANGGGADKGGEAYQLRPDFLN